MYLLDTNHCSRIIFGEENLIRRLQEYRGLGVATSVIVQGELLFMVQKSSQKEANLPFVRTFLQTIDLYPIRIPLANRGLDPSIARKTAPGLKPRANRNKAC
jgi:tRNA(fMet)-specific endonuclease VapC